jgi:ribosome-associated protein
VDPIVVGSRIRIPPDELDVSFARGQGPGGQNVNKVNSKAVLYWGAASSPSLPPDVRERFLAKYHRRMTTEGVLVLSSDRFRDQRRNIEDCVEKLTAMLLEVLEPPKPRKKTKPSRGSVERRIAEKKATSARKQNRRGGKGGWD